MERTVAHQPRFDFCEVNDVNDPRFLPGGVKYGGWGAFAALAAPDPLGLIGSGDIPEVLAAAYASAGVEGRLRQAERVDLASLIRRLLR